MECFFYVPRFSVEDAWMFLGERLYSEEYPSEEELGTQWEELDLEELFTEMEDLMESAQERFEVEFVGTDEIMTDFMVHPELLKDRLEKDMEELIAKGEHLELKLTPHEEDMLEQAATEDEKQNLLDGWRGAWLEESAPDLD